MKDDFKEICQCVSVFICCNYVNSLLSRCGRPAGGVDVEAVKPGETYSVLLHPVAPGGGLHQLLLRHAGRPLQQVQQVGAVAPQELLAGGVPGGDPGAPAEQAQVLAPGGEQVGGLGQVGWGTDGRGQAGTWRGRRGGGRGAPGSRGPRGTGGPPCSGGTPPHTQGQPSRGQIAVKWPVL